MEGVQCCLNIDDVVEAEALLKRNPAFLHYIRERYGVEDVDSVACDPWYSGEPWEGCATRCRPTGACAWGLLSV